MFTLFKKNLACLIELDRVERVNDKNVRHRELKRYSLLENTFLFQSFVEEWGNLVPRLI